MARGQGEERRSTAAVQGDPRRRRRVTVEQFGRYRIVRPLATGGMGEVLLAQTAWLDGFSKDVVLKRIRPEYCKDPAFVSMFLDEARLSIQLTHPNVVQVFDFGEYDGQHFLAMEYVRGYDVNMLIQHPRVQHKGMDVAAALFIIAEVCQALDYAHNKSDRSGEPLHIVHRDVTPQNIFISDLGAVKVGDFGIAKARTSLREAQPGELVGNLSYMAPEAVEGKEVDSRTDLFSAGLVLREMLLGVPTYSAANSVELATLVIQALISPASNFRGDVPRAVDDMLDRALTKDPDARIQTARDFYEAIHAVLTAEFPKFNSFAFRTYLEDLARDIPTDSADTSSTPVLGRSSRAMQRPETRTAPVRMSSVEFDWTPELVQAVENFQRAPDVWQIVTIGDVCRQAGEAASAASAYRVASHKFAQAGLLGPALLTSRLMMHSLPDADLHDEIANLPTLVDKSDAEIGSLL
ncbi:MAG: serine/threonine-protein kinase, partial [Myxococcota bacterium]